MVEHGRTDNRTLMHTVVQTTTHGHTKNPQLPEWPTLKVLAWVQSAAMLKVEYLGDTAFCGILMMKNGSLTMFI